MFAEVHVCKKKFAEETFLYPVLLNYKSRAVAKGLLETILVASHFAANFIKPIRSIKYVLSIGTDFNFQIYMAFLF